MLIIQLYIHIQLLCYTLKTNVIYNMHLYLYIYIHTELDKCILKCKEKAKIQNTLQVEYLKCLEKTKMLKSSSIQNVCHCYRVRQTNAIEQKAEHKSTHVQYPNMTVTNYTSEGKE